MLRWVAIESDEPIHATAPLLRTTIEPTDWNDSGPVETSVALRELIRRPSESRRTITSVLAVSTPQVREA
jgi:hypothetical protein